MTKIIKHPSPSIDLQLKGGEITTFFTVLLNHPDVRLGHCANKPWLQVPQPWLPGWEKDDGPELGFGQPGTGMGSWAGSWQCSEGRMLQSKQGDTRLVTT